MARYQVILAYDGARYRGFQRLGDDRQGLGEATVQAVFEAALRNLGWQGQAILAAGRTDSGVHAAAQVVAFDLEWNHAPEALRDALNAYLPADIAARQVQQSAEDFHPRYAASLRCYRYRLFFDPVRDPLRERYAWRVWPATKADLLHQAAACLVGRHDFAAFGAPMHPGASTKRTVSMAAWHLELNDWTFEICADAFLYHMVRRLVFAQVKVGQGKRSLASLIDLVEHPENGLSQGLAPAHGLTLQRVDYLKTPS